MLPQYTVLNIKSIIYLNGLITIILLHGPYSALINSFSSPSIIIYLVVLDAL